MPWHPLDNPDADEIGRKRKTRFLVDESLGVEVARYLRGKGYNALFVGDVDLVGHSDEDIFAYAWREKRMLWTHDRDFLDDARFPEHRNPGVVVLPGGDGTIGLWASASARHYKCLGRHHPFGRRRNLP